MYSFCNDTFHYIKHVINHLDVGYLSWVAWVVYPVILSFILPAFIAVLIYASALFLLIYRRRNYIRDGYAVDFWSGARKTLAAFWEVHGRIWYGFEIVGLDQIPATDPVLIVFYHGVIPIDFYYIVCKCILERGRTMRLVGDHFLFSIPGWRILTEVFFITPGTVESCVEVLRGGHILAISPGGVREALFGDVYYETMWSKRSGFAKVAIQAKVPVIPVFTQNCREAFRTPHWCRDWLRGLYERTRLPILPIYGGFPVKLRSIFGKPIYPDEDSTPEEFAVKIHRSMEEMIRKNQRIPGNILLALLDRFITLPHAIR